MRRTQLYLDDDLWQTLQVEASQSGTSLSELVRRAVGDRYGNSRSARRQAMQAWIGAWKNRKDLPSSERYVRRLRRLAS